MPDTAINKLKNISDTVRNMQYVSNAMRNFRRPIGLAVALPALAAYALACRGSAEEVTPSPTANVQPTPTASASYSPTQSPAPYNCITDKTYLVLLFSIKTDDDGTKYISFDEKGFFYVSDEETDSFMSYTPDRPTYLIQEMENGNVVRSYQLSVTETSVSDPGGLNKFPRTSGDLRIPLKGDSLRALEPHESGEIVFEKYKPATPAPGESGETPSPTPLNRYRLMDIEKDGQRTQSVSLAPEVLCDQN